MPNSLLRRYSSAMSASRTFTAAVHREEDWYVAQCLEVDVASQGHTIDEALANLAEAVELYQRSWTIRRATSQAHPL